VDGVVVGNDREMSERGERKEEGRGRSERKKREVARADGEWFSATEQYITENENLVARGPSQFRVTQKVLHMLSLFEVFRR